MESSSHATVGIAGHYDTSTRQGAWAVVIRLDGRELLLHGVLARAGAHECERYGIQTVARALRRLNAPLRAIEVTSEVKQALIRPYLRGAQAHGWAAARKWWKSVMTTAGVRVTRKLGDAYSAAERVAEITSITGVEKLGLTAQEVDTPWNRERSAELAERRAERATARRHVKRRREREETNEYAQVTGAGSPRPRPPPGYKFESTPPSETRILDEMLLGLRSE